MKNLGDLCEEILVAWAKGANIPVPDKNIRAPWLPDLMDLAKAIQKGLYTPQDITDFVREKCKDSWNRSRPQTWGIKAVSRDLYAWLQLQQETNNTKPPEGFRNYYDPQGRAHIWDWRTGTIKIIEPGPDYKPKPSKVQGKPYKKLAPGEVITKRIGREGYQRDFFLMGETDLSPEELRQLHELAGDDDNATTG